MVTVISGNWEYETGPSRSVYRIFVLQNHDQNLNALTDYPPNFQKEMCSMAVVPVRCFTSSCTLCLAERTFIQVRFAHILLSSQQKVSLHSPPKYCFDVFIFKHFSIVVQACCHELCLMARTVYLDVFEKGHVCKSVFEPFEFFSSRLSTHTFIY